MCKLQGIQTQALCNDTAMSTVSLNAACCYCGYRYVINILNIQDWCSRTQGSVQPRNKDESKVTDKRWKEIRMNKYVFVSFNDLRAETPCWKWCMLNWSLTRDTGSLWTTECPDTAFFIFHASQRESTEADGGQTHTRTHTHAHTRWHLGPGNLLTFLLRPGGAQSVVLPSGSAVTTPVMTLLTQGCPEDRTGRTSGGL